MHQSFDWGGEGLGAVKDDPSVFGLTARRAELSATVYRDENERRSRFGEEIVSGVDQARFLPESLV